MSIKVLGLDPGASGAAALIRSSDDVEVCRFAKASQVEVARVLHGMVQEADLIALEKVGPMPTDAKGAVFKFGAAWGFLRGVVFGCAGRGRFVEPSPQTWQRELGIPARKKTESKTQHKRRIRQRAEELYPAVSMTADVPDALLIGHWALTVELPKQRGESA